jgi:hypothetical protein
MPLTRYVICISHPGDEFSGHPTDVDVKVDAVTKLQAEFESGSEVSISETLERGLSS